MGDFNSSLYSSDQDRFQRFCTNLDLVDPWETLFPEEKDTATYFMGSSRIDYILTDRDILPHVRGFGLTGINKPFITDHRATFMDLDFGSLFHETMAPLKKQPRRMVTSKIDVRTKKFLELVGDAMKKERMLARASRILNDADTLGPVESVGKAFTLLDRDFRNILLRCEKRAGRKSESAAWSTQLHMALLEGRFWRTYRRVLRKGKSPTPRVQALSDCLGWPCVPQVDFATASNSLKKAQKKFGNLPATTRSQGWSISSNAKRRRKS